MSAVLWRLILGLALATLGWLSARGVAEAWRFRPVAAVMTDEAAPLVCFVALCAETARPLSAGALTLAAFGGFAFADAMKRRILREPVVFTDISEVVELVRHPELYVPFVGTGRVTVGAIAAVATVALLGAAEPAIFVWSPTLTLIALAASLEIVPLLAGPLLAWSAGRLCRFAPSGDPAFDAKRLGPFAMLVAHGLIARRERAAHQRAAALRIARPAPIAAPPPPLVIVQSESFFDARRVHASVARDLLPGFDACRANGLQWGRLAVPTWRR